MNEVANCILQIGKVSGRLEKEALLVKYSDVNDFKEVLQFIFDPYVRTGIGAAKINNCNEPTTNINDTWKQAINYFKVFGTGTQIDVIYAKSLIDSQTTDEAKIIARAIATKELKIGVTATTLNKVYGDNFIPKIGVMLAEKWEEQKDKVKGPFIVTEKYDGVRRLLVKEKGVSRFYSRSGILDEGLVELEEETKYLPDNCVYDGELLAIGDFNDCIELRQATNSLAARKGEKRGLSFNVFDCIALADFKLGKSTHNALNRKMFVAAIFKDELSLTYFDADDIGFMLDTFGAKYDFKFIKAAPVLGIANTETDVLEFASPIWKRGYEGVMLNTFIGMYEQKRTKQLLKVKLVKTYILKVIDMLEGEGRNAGRLGALVVEYKGQRVGVGTGLNDQQREDFWNNRSILAKQIEIDSFGESVDNTTGAVSLNCPVFKRIVGHME